jgi:hypothetical protein
MANCFRRKPFLRLLTWRRCSRPIRWWFYDLTCFSGVFVSKTRPTVWTRQWHSSPGTIVKWLDRGCANRYSGNDIKHASLISITHIANLNRQPLLTDNDNKDFIPGILDNTSMRIKLRKNKKYRIYSNRRPLPIEDHSLIEDHPRQAIEK